LGLPAATLWSLVERPDDRIVRQTMVKPACGRDNQSMDLVRAARPAAYNIRLTRHPTDTTSDSQKYPIKRTMRKQLAMPLLVVGCLMGLGLWGWGADGDRPSKPRAKPKKFDQATTSRVFFDNVFAEVVGTRPNLSSPDRNNGVAANPQAAPTTNGNGPTNAAGGGNGTWSQLISAATIEDEIKSLKMALDQDVTTPGDFKGRGYKLCRTHFSVAAMLFAVIGEYDADIRWKSDAVTARDLFARTAANAKVGTDQVFNEARQRKADLSDLLNGNSLAARPAETDHAWSALVDRSPLMPRLQVAFNGQVRQLTSNEAEFKANRDGLRHEAEMIALISDVLCKEGMVDADDDTYTEYAHTMREAARDLVQAAKDVDYAKAREAVGRLDQACATCHESYR
jgi:hypothetical protein